MSFIYYDNHTRSAEKLLKNIKNHMVIKHTDKLKHNYKAEWFLGLSAL